MKSRLPETAIQLQKLSRNFLRPSQFLFNVDTLCTFVHAYSIHLYQQQYVAKDYMKAPMVRDLTMHRGRYTNVH
jgi:hypothetical protein